MEATKSEPPQAKFSRSSVCSDEYDWCRTKATTLDDCRITETNSKCCATCAALWKEGIRSELELKEIQAKKLERKLNEQAECVDWFGWCAARVGFHNGTLCGPN